MQRRPPFDSRARNRACFLPLWAALFVVLLGQTAFARTQAESFQAGTDRPLATTVTGPDEASVALTGFVRDDSSPLLLAAAAPRNASGTAKGAGGAEAGQQAQPADTAAKEAAPAKGAAPAKPGIRLFGTVEFRGALKNMPKWQRVVTAEQRSRTFDGNLGALMPGSVHKQWVQLVERVKDKSDMEKAKAVTAFFNRWPYKTDQAVYKVADYWATPAEFMKNSGDCEDYAITKLYALMKLGVDPDNMRIVALKDTIRNLAHAILIVYMNNDAYVLDNLTDMVLTHARYKHYQPQYSVNEVYRWAHVLPKKK